MDEPGWFLLISGVLFAIGLTQPLMRRLPLTNAIVYLAIGIILGPTILGVRTKPALAHCLRPAWQSRTP